MGNNQQVRDSFTRLERELLEEKVSALARIGGILERVLTNLAEIRSRLDGAPELECARLGQAHQRLLEQATLYRWYLEVQREALGLRSHHRLDERYKVPGPLPTRVAAVGRSEGPCSGTSQPDGCSLRKKP